MSANRARIAQATACDTGGCYTGHLIVRGDQISFLSSEADAKYRRQGYTRQVKDGDVHWDPEMPDSDIDNLPASYVLVHDTSGHLLTKCDLYVVRWRSANSGRINTSEIDQKLYADAKEYFVSPNGNELSIGHGSVEIPAGKWKRETRVKYIRYRRPGFPKTFEHDYDPDVELMYCTSPLMWRLPLPTGCVVDSRGFVWP